MPMTFMDEMVSSRLKMAGLDTSGTSAEKRERAAAYTESKYEDYVEGWEIRTGKPWDEMTTGEAMRLIESRPHLKNNAGIFSILMKGAGHG